ncbi:MAG: LysR substrate-binding domain-containing protein, partial [Casimicrobium sp.]
DPSVISRTIAAMEEALGFRLFQRTTRKLAPTEAGAIYYERIRHALEELEQAKLQAGDASAEPTGTLRVTASVTFGQKWLVPKLAAFRKAYPSLALELLLTDTNIDLVAERIDIAVRLGPRVDSGMVGTLLMPTRYYVVASPGYVKKLGQPKRPEDIAAHDCLLLPLSGYRTRWIFRDERARQTKPTKDISVPVRGSLTISTALGLHQAVLDGLGPALLANWVVDDDLKSGKLVDLFPKHRVTATDFETAVRLLYPSRAYLPLKVRVFIDFLKSFALK